MDGSDSEGLVSVSAPDDIVEFWASLMDAMLQQFAVSHRSGNVQSLANDCHRLAQVGKSMDELFSRLVAELASNGANMEESARAASVVKNVINRHVARVQGSSSVKTLPEPEPAKKVVPSKFGSN